MKRSALMLVIFLSNNAFAAILTVGTGAGCTHGTIQSALDAAAAAPGADTVRLTRSLTYEPEAGVINDSGNLNLVGGFATCDQAATDNIKTLVSGAGGAAEPVLRIHAATGVVVKLRQLVLTLGDEDGGGGGGGIYFDGDGGLELIETDVTNNTADYGGGIYAEGLGSNAELVISNGNTISGNIARYSGGGVYVAGPLEMTMIAPDSLIAFNQALGQGSIGGYGGGLHVQGPAIAYIGTSGAFGLGAIYGNSAIDGGGVSIQSGASAADARVHLFTTSPQLPVTISGNSASDTGGGIYLQAYAGFFDDSFAHLCAWDFRIEGNFARDGSAIYQNSDSFDDIGYNGGDVHLNDPACMHPAAQRCAPGVTCNTISGNDAGPTNGGPEDGATIRLLEGANLDADRFEMRENRGGYAIRAQSWLYPGISSCLLADNEFTRQVISTEDGSTFIDDCTLAGNALGSTDVLHMEGALFLHRSIIDQPGHLSLAHSGDPESLDVSHVLATDITTLPEAPSIIAGAAGFVDAASGDYHLRSNSLAVDFAPPVVGDDRDLDNQPRDQNLPGTPDLFGVRDLGAYERQVGLADCGAVDSIFCNGFDPS